MATVCLTETSSRSALIADAFVAARRSGSALADYPGALPQDLDFAYLCQDKAIEIWGDSIIGWKVGGVPPSLWQALGTTRVAGPIFAGALRHARPQQVVDFPIFDGGFAAVEAEFCLRLGEDASTGQTEWSIEQAFALVDAVYLSVETAGSPLASINDLGSIVVASDFGNNAGLILGAEISGWQDRGFEQVDCVTRVDGSEVGRGSARSLTGGAIESLRFLLENCARRGRALRAGSLVATGAVTGVHNITAGQSAHISYGDYGSIACRAVSFGHAL